MNIGGGPVMELLNADILDAIPLGVDIVDRELNILFQNKTMKESLGGNYAGNKCYKVYKDHQTQCGNCPMEKDRSRNAGHVIETDHALGGRSFKITHNFVRFQGKDAVLEIFEDITESKLAKQQLSDSNEKLKGTLSDIVTAFAAVVEIRDPYTAGHQHRVANLAKAISLEMGLDPQVVQGIHVAGMLHDLGKIAVPAEILSKPGRLHEIELSLIKLHPVTGHKMLSHIAFEWPIAEIVLQHHERMDGLGYPNGLTGDNIRLEARILAVADVVEAISSHRPYRPALGIGKALEEIETKKGILYDGDVTDACVKALSSKTFTFER